MANIALDGTPCKTKGNLPKVGSKAPDFTLTKTDLSDFSLSDYQGKKVLLSIFPSIHTGVCSQAARTFSKKLEMLDHVTVICISKDLPFAHHHFCEAEGIINLVMASQYKDSSFSDAYPVEIISGAFKGLFSRAIILIKEDGIVAYTEQVPDIGQAPDYNKVFAALDN